MSIRFQWSETNRQSVADSVAADASIKQQLIAIVDQFQQENPQVLMGFTSEFKELSKKTFFDLNRLAAQILDAAPDFEKLAAIFDHWMLHDSPAVERPADAFQAIEVLQRYADFMYGLVVGEMNSLEARDMWNATKGYYADFNKQQIPFQQNY